MTFADLLYKIWCAVSAHRTKLVGCAISVLGYLSTQPDLLAPKWVSACVVASGILTTLCGVANTTTIASKVAAQLNPTKPAIPAQE